MVWHENVGERNEAFLLNKVNWRKTESHSAMLEGAGPPGSVTKYTSEHLPLQQSWEVWKEEAEKRMQLETSTLYPQE